MGPQFIEYMGKIYVSFEPTVFVMNLTSTFSSIVLTDDLLTSYHCRYHRSEIVDDLRRENKLSRMSPSGAKLAA